MEKRTKIILSILGVAVLGTAIYILLNKKFKTIQNNNNPNNNQGKSIVLNSQNIPTTITAGAGGVMVLSAVNPLTSYQFFDVGQSIGILQNDAGDTFRTVNLPNDSTNYYILKGTNVSY